MKRKIFTLLLSALVCTYVMAQSVRPTAVIQKAGAVKPVIDGKMDDVWAGVPQNDVILPFKTEVPTLGDVGTTYWKAVYDDAGIYIIIVANDDVWFPLFGQTGAAYTYDKIELYFDTNPILADATGGQGGASGNRQIAPDPTDGKIDGTKMSQTILGGSVDYAYNVANPAWTTEWFVPWESIPDKDGNNFDKSATMGFDVDISDNDNDGAGRKRAMWSNDGTRGAKDEDWNNMDEAGWVTFEGAAAPILIEGLAVTASAQTITVDNGQVQFTVEITPADANQAYKWSIVGGTGEATIDKNGLLQAVRNGTVDVQAVSSDGFITSNTTTVTITNQKVTNFEASYLKDGDFTQGVGTKPSAFWMGGALIEDGVATCSNPAVAAAPNPWDWTFSQMMYVPYADKDLNYIFQFKAWADAERTFTVDMEDVANGYPRYGVSTDATSTSGTSDWTWNMTTVPTTYTMHVTFTNMLPTASQKMNFMLGLATPKVYIDSVILVKSADYVASAQTLNANTMNVYPNPVGNASELTVNLTSMNAKVSVFNSLGQKLMEKTANGNVVKFNVASLQRGMYFVRLEDGTSQKFIK